MGRLTYYNERGFAYVNHENCANGCNDLIDKLAHYEDLEEQGRLIELPCAVGDTVWLVEKAFPQYPPIKFKFSRKSDIMREMEKGMIFTKTKEEAEAKLEELKG